MTIKANDPSLRSWIEISRNSDFPIQNLPFGIFRAQGREPRVGVAIGDQVLDLAALNELGFLSSFKLGQNIFQNQYLNDLIALGKPVTNALRQRVSDLLNADSSELRDKKDAHSKVLHSMSAVEMLMPVKVGDYTDFY